MLDQQLSPSGVRPDVQTYDVAIVGAGIVGLTLACALKESGLRIALIEAKPRSIGLSQRRAYHISLMSGRILAGLGVWNQILPQITTFEQIDLADADCPAVVALQPRDLGTPALGYVAEHCVLLQALQQALLNAENVEWLCPATVLDANYNPDRTRLTLNADGQKIQIASRLLVAADGARSPIRTAAGIATHGWQYWQSCITAVIRPEKSHGSIAREHFWSSGPFATLPLPDNRCQIVLTAPHAEAQALMQIDDRAFLAELDRRYQGKLGQLTLEGNRLLFPVQLMHSDRYTQARLALIGDAAHCCHPVGGQGLNLGIRDAAALAQVILKAHDRHEDIGDLRVLHRYERWRKLENLVILGFTDLLDRFFSNRWWPIVLLRRLGLRLMRQLRPLRSIALRLMTGLSGRHPSLAKQSIGTKLRSTRAE
ncbi:FAD-dependent hydroxylase [Microcoleus sp. FACHB-1515]|uniref:FAD-dependent hydroxylase n=1 Tax=Cyanophyceae TaxID=3028117 RepID=UPI001683A203|nr:FAD-dependent hydroxylase [Microcoleus sp. FACHB-1515]MBD2092641.1 FAD-dependent hydroxylase [Microcoleus sp. FACHB-1515]